MTKTPENKKQLYVGVFDSGYGGITVLRSLAKHLPNEDFIYFGDNAYAPYGTKTPEEVLIRSQTILSHFKNKGIKALVIACNTATSAAAAELRRTNPDLPIIGVEPAIKPAACFTDHPRVLILATPMTIRLEKFRSLAEGLSDKADFIMLPLPHLVELIEIGKANSEETEDYLRSMLSPYIASPPDAVVLGCTHFPFVKPQIAGILGTKTVFFDGAEGAARQLKKTLSERGLQNERPENGRIIFESSKNDPSITDFMKSLYEGIGS